MVEHLSRMCKDISSRMKIQNSGGSSGGSMGFLQLKRQNKHLFTKPGRLKLE